MKPPFRIIRVIYRDPAMDWTWDHTQDYEPVRCSVVGFEVKLTPDYLHVAAELVGDDECRAVTHIPTVCVDAVTELVAKPKKGGA